MFLIYCSSNSGDILSKWITSCPPRPYSAWTWRWATSASQTSAAQQLTSLTPGAASVSHAMVTVSLMSHTRATVGFLMSHTKVTVGSVLSHPWSTVGSLMSHTRVQLGLCHTVIARSHLGLYWVKQGHSWVSYESHQGHSRVSIESPMVHSWVSNVTPRNKITYRYKNRHKYLYKPIFT